MGDLTPLLLWRYRRMQALFFYKSIYFLPGAAIEIKDNNRNRFLIKDKERRQKRLDFFKKRDTIELALEEKEC
ncbi:MAG: hypothetical protein IK104_12155 [Clostridia bacterium]|nr:hypothetical protein [Clostridia bacterium]